MNRLRNETPRGLEKEEIKGGDREIFGDHKIEGQIDFSGITLWKDKSIKSNVSERQ